MQDCAVEIEELCLRLLTYREHSQQELLRKLALKGYTASMVHPVLNKLAVQDWQSESRFAHTYARQRLQKGYGPLRVAYELRQRGIGAVDLDSIVLEIADGWMGLLQQTYLTKFPHQVTISRAEWAKRTRFLLQRGFAAAMVNALFKQLQLKFE